MEQEQQTLYIPINIKTSTEFFEGYGTKELVRTIIATVIGGIFCLIYFAAGGTSTTCIVLFLSIIAGTIMFVVKDRNNLSVFDQIVNMVHFAKSQKKYHYEYLDEWR